MSANTVIQDRQLLVDDFHRELQTSTPGVYCVAVLIGINILVYIGMLVSGVSPADPRGAQLIHWGALFGPATIHGQWWRLLTACFIHLSPFHLAGNMFFLFWGGFTVERLYGNVRFLILYLLAGIGGNIASLYFQPFHVSAGASGAICGIYGAMLAFALMQRKILPWEIGAKLLRSAVIFLLYSVLAGISKPEIDSEAHLAGVGAGFVLGCMFAQRPSALNSGKTLTRTLTVASIGIVALVAACVTVPKEALDQSSWYTAIIEGSHLPVPNRSTLFYGGSVTKQQAESLAAALGRSPVTTHPNLTFLFLKDEHGASLSVPVQVDETLEKQQETMEKNFPGVTIAHTYIPWKDPAFLQGLQNLGAILAPVVGASQFTLRVVNSRGELKKEILIQAKAVQVGSSDEIIYSGTASEHDAVALGEVLRASGYLADRGAVVLLAKGSGPATVAFIVKDGVWNSSNADRLLKATAYKIAPALGGLPVRVQMDDNNRIPRKEIVAK